MDKYTMEFENVPVFEHDFNMEENNEEDVTNPEYYKQGTMECIDAIEGLNLSFHEAQVLKYITRWRKKGGYYDLKKAQWYLNRLIEKEFDKDLVDTIEREQQCE
jgi:hypothetical protein